MVRERLPKGGRSHAAEFLRSDRLGAFVVVAILVTVGAANLLWSAGVPSTSNPARMPPTTDPFPVLPAAAHLYVVPIPPTANTSEQLTLLSLQGLVNRNRAELYLDFSNESGNATSMLTFLTQRYGVSYDVVTPDWAFARYLPGLAGIVVYDPSRPESVNIVTMMAALEDAVIAGPDTAAVLHAAYGLPILFDYATSNWTALDAVGAYDRALREFYPSMAANLLAILPPDRLPLRDYLIATRTFVFYDEQGVLASPADLASTQRILAATPRGIPILGWFNSPTLTEENAFVQLASQYGKEIVGSQTVPNLSVLTAYGRNETHVQLGSPGGPVTLQNKTYAVVAVPDGDNLDFVADRMRTLWAEPERGTFPLAWSLSPLLASLAPPYLDYYYASASPEDRFVAGPSGAGYLYPDYLGSGDLTPYLEFTGRYLNATDMDVAWLLNAFTASEIPYRPTTLSAYVDGLHPRGLVLDYDDQPKTQDAWIQSGTTASAPVIRSTQMWTTVDNFMAKVSAAIASWGGGAHFLWITVYTFRFDLGDARAMIDELSNRTNGNLVLVTPEQLFSLLEQDVQARAQAMLTAMRADPFVATFLNSDLTAAQNLLETPSSGADAATRAANAYGASQDLQAAALEETVFVLGLFLLSAAASVALGRRRGYGRGRPSLAEARSLLMVAAAFALFFLALRASLAANFWSYQWILVGILLGGFGRPLRRYIDKRYPRVGLPATAAFDLVFVALSLGTNVAFALAAIGTVAVLDAVAARVRVRPGTFVLGVALGCAAGFLVAVDPVSYGVLGLLLLGPLVTLPARARPGAWDTAKGGWIRGGILALPLFGLAVASNYSLALRLQIQGAGLTLLAVVLLAFGSLIGLLVARGSSPTNLRMLHVLSFVAAGAFALATAFSEGTVGTAILLLGMAASFTIAGETTLRSYVARGGDPSAVIAGAVAWIPLIVLFLRMPPVVYSLTLARFPEGIEAILYAPEFLFAGVAAVLAVVAWHRSRRPRGQDAV